MFDEIKTSMALRLGLPEAEVFSEKSLAWVLAAAPQAVNSIDLLDAFAGALADHGIEEEAELPTFTLQHTANDVIDALRLQFVQRA